jgi:anti-anti-sigma factor
VFWEITREENRTVITVRGAVDFEEVEAFRELLEKHVGGSGTVVLDLGRCEFLCSMAVGTILGFKIESNLSGGDLWIVNASDTIRRLFEIVNGAEAVFPCPPPQDTPECSPSY